MELNLQSSHHLELYRVPYFGFTVLPSSGDLVVLGQAAPDEAYALHIYRLSGGHLQRRRLVISPCQHPPNAILGLIVQTQELIVVACEDCKDIKLIHPQTGKATIAYENRHNPPDYLCQGEPGRLWVYSGNDHQLIELNYEKKIFTETGKRFTAVVRVRWLQYLHGFREALLHAGEHYGVYAQSTQDGSMLWRLEGQVDGRKIDPYRLLLTPDHQAVLCADPSNNRILVLNPADGSVLQIIQLPDEVGYPYDLNWCRDQLVLSSLECIDQYGLSFFAATINQQPLFPPLSGEFRLSLLCFDLPSSQQRRSDCQKIRMLESGAPSRC